MAISKVASQADARIVAEEEAAIRQRAARQAANVPVDQPPPELVNVKVTKLGSGKISMGVHVAAAGDAFYERGEPIMGVEKGRAIELEDKGWVEIED